MTMTAVEGEVQPKKDQAKSGPYRELQHGLIDIARIEIRAQHRKLFNERAMKELTDNVRHVGILEPILLRYKEAGKNGYILIAGERRLRAAKGAGLIQIPSRVLDVTEEQAAEIQALENLHREGLGPIEEARAFKTLLEQGKYDVRGLAERVDKSATYVYQALALLELPKAELDLVEKGDMSSAHAHQILRLPKENRPGFYAAWLKLSARENWSTTAADLRNHIEARLGGDLKKAPWPKDKEYAGKPACAGCPFNSANQTELFAGAEAGRCTNTGCFTVKSEQADKDKVTQLTAKFPGVKVLPSALEHEIERKHKVVDIPGRVFNDKRVQDLIKHQPGYFSIAMVKHQEWDDGEQTEELKPSFFIAESSKKLILGIIGKNHQDAYHFGYTYEPSARASAAQKKANENRRSPQEAFVDRFLDAEVFKEMVAKAKPDMMTTKLIDSETNAYFSMGVKERLAQLGYSGEAAVRKAAEKLDTEGRVRLLFALLMSKTTWGTADSAARAAGIDVKAVKAKHKAAAEKAWLDRRKGGK